METPENETTKIKFKPSFNTCYRPDLNYKNKCNECEFREYVLCKNSPNYEKAKKEMKNT